MILSTQTSVMAGAFGDVEAVKIFAKNGYDALDFSMFGMTDPKHFLYSSQGLEHLKEVRRTADQCGVIFNQAHAPFPSWLEGREDFNEFMKTALPRSIEYAAVLGVSTIIIHPISIPEDLDAQKAANMELYHSLEDTLRSYRMKAALENMFLWDQEAGKAFYGACAQWEQFNDYLDALDPELFTACLDIGHSGLVGIPAADMIRGLGHDRLGALHVHDNDNRTDMHTLPFTQSLDWKAITAALRDIDYKGEFTFEADFFLTKFPDPLKPSASKLMHDVGRHLISMIENP